jgi:hypothetical protein
VRDEAGTGDIEAGNISLGSPAAYRQTAGFGLSAGLGSAASLRETSLQTACSLEILLESQFVHSRHWVRQERLCVPLLALWAIGLPPCVAFQNRNSDAFARVKYCLQAVGLN